MFRNFFQLFARPFFSFSVKQKNDEKMFNTKKRKEKIYKKVPRRRNRLVDLMALTRLRFFSRTASESVGNTFNELGTGNCAYGSSSRFRLALLALSSCSNSFNCSLVNWNRKKSTYLRNTKRKITFFLIFFFSIFF